MWNKLSFPTKHFNLVNFQKQISYFPLTSSFCSMISGANLNCLSIYISIRRISRLILFTSKSVVEIVGASKSHNFGIQALQCVDFPFPLTFKAYSIWWPNIFLFSTLFYYFFRLFMVENKIRSRKGENTGWELIVGLQVWTCSRIVPPFGQEKMFNIYILIEGKMCPCENRLSYSWATPDKVLIPECLNFNFLQLCTLS